MWDLQRPPSNLVILSPLLILTCHVKVGLGKYGLVGAARVWPSGISRLRSPVCFCYHLVLNIAKPNSANGGGRHPRLAATSPFHLPAGGKWWSGSVSWLVRLEPLWHQVWLVKMLHKHTHKHTRTKSARLQTQAFEFQGKFPWWSVNDGQALAAAPLRSACAHGWTPRPWYDLSDLIYLQIHLPCRFSPAGKSAPQLHVNILKDRNHTCTCTCTKPATSTGREKDWLSLHAAEGGSAASWLILLFIILLLILTYTSLLVLPYWFNWSLFSCGGSIRL